MPASCYDGKIAECRRPVESTTDPVEKAAYVAMEDEFREKARVMTGDVPGIGPASVQGRSRP